MLSGSAWIFPKPRKYGEFKFKWLRKCFCLRCLCWIPWQHAVQILDILAWDALHWLKSRNFKISNLFICNFQTKNESDFLLQLQNSSNSILKKNNLVKIWKKKTPKKLRWLEEIKKIKIRIHFRFQSWNLSSFNSMLSFYGVFFSPVAIIDIVSKITFLK